MSLNINGEKCALCKAYLFPEDDIVYCPECGAPHHRECYNTIGHCALTEYHGTDKQYKKPTQPETEKSAEFSKNDKTMTTCQMCGELYDKNDAACSACGTPNISKMGGKIITFDFLGGVPADMDLGNGVTANEAKRFVASNTQRYIPKFATFNIGKKFSWNWAAFLFPCAWFASRKMYAKSTLIGTIQIAFTMLLLPFNKAVSYLDFSEVQNYFEASEIIMQNIDKIGQVAIWAAFIGMALNFILRIICALIADFTYKKRVISEVDKIKKNNNADIEYHRRGGISLAAALLAVLAVEYLPSVFALLTGIL